MGTNFYPSVEHYKKWKLTFNEELMKIFATRSLRFLEIGALFLCQQLLRFQQEKRYGSWIDIEITAIYVHEFTDSFSRFPCKSKMAGPDRVTVFLLLI